MSSIDRYLKQATEALRSNDTTAIDSAAREIVSAFQMEIPHLSSYRGSRISLSDSGSSDRHSASDLKKLIGKLLVLRDAKDEEKYGRYGLSSITSSIRQLEDALLDGIEFDELEALYMKIDHLYANVYHAYTDGLCGWGYTSAGDAPSEMQTTLRIEKLRHYRDQELRELVKAEHQGHTITTTASAPATAMVNVSLEATFERIEEIPDQTLSDDAKTMLKGLLADLEHVKDDKDKSRGKLDKLVTWLSGKGTDVFFALIPYLAQFIQSAL